ncbi:unnamed protein product [Sphagnum balticum]
MVFKVNQQWQGGMCVIFIGTCVFIVGTCGGIQVNWVRVQKAVGLINCAATSAMAIGQCTGAVLPVSNAVGPDECRFSNTRARQLCVAAKQTIATFTGEYDQLLTVGRRQQTSACHLTRPPVGRRYAHLQMTCANHRIVPVATAGA